MELLQFTYPHASRTEWETIVGLNQLEVNGEVASLECQIYCGDKIERLVPHTIEPPINPNISVLHEDNELFIVNKPAPLPIHPCGRYNKNSLTGLAKLAWPDLHLRPAHRIDANTTGITVFTKCRKAAGLVQYQFEKLAVNKSYLTLVEGHPPQREFTIDSAISSKPNRLGLRKISKSGQSSLTHFVVLAYCENGSSIIEAKPKTGRTNQIRIHLQQAGHAIVGDGAYGSNPELTQGFTSNQQVLHLHAWKIGFTHPSTRHFIQFETPLPTWALSLW